jgi:hypothetical protein
MLIINCESITNLSVRPIINDKPTLKNNFCLNQSWNKQANLKNYNGINSED